MALLQSLPAAFDDPVLYAVLVLAIFAVVQYQRTISWGEYRFLHGLKRRILPVVDRYTSLFVVSRKGGYEDPEFLCTVTDDVATVFKRLVGNGGSPHLINALKVRTVLDENQYSAAHVVFFHDDGQQSEAYLFHGKHGDETDVYVHVEPGVVDAKDHLEGEQRDGDPRGVVREALK
jgi:hypothetical protein